MELHRHIIPYYRPGELFQCNFHDSIARWMKLQMLFVDVRQGRMNLDTFWSSLHCTLQFHLSRLGKLYYCYYHRVYFDQVERGLIESKTHLVSLVLSTF